MHKDYEIGYGKPPISGRIKKGERRNPWGRPKKAPPELDPGKLLQAADNEERLITVDGKRVTMRQAEINFRQLFAKGIEGDLTVASIIAKMAAKYFGPDAEGPGETRFLVRDENGKIRREKKNAIRKPPGRQSPERIAIGVLFRTVARDLLPVQANGKRAQKISYFEAYLRKIYERALAKDTRAIRLLEQLRRDFPGELLPGDPITFILYPSDEGL